MARTRAQCKAAAERHANSAVQSQVPREQDESAITRSHTAPEEDNDSAFGLKATRERDCTVDTQSQKAREQDGDTTTQPKVVVPRDRGAAAKEVANTYELVEQILLRLRDLSPTHATGAEIISKTFQHVLQRSVNLRPSVHIPSKDALFGETEMDDDYNDCTIERFEPYLEIFEVLQITRRAPSADMPELSLTGQIPYFRMNSPKWRKPGSWRSWPLLLPTTKYIQRLHVRGMGDWTPRGENRWQGWWEMDMSYRSETAIALGDLVDLAYEMREFCGGVVTVEFDVAVDEEGVGKRHWSFAEKMIYGEGEGAVDGEIPAEFPEWHEVMEAAWRLKNVWKAKTA